MIRWWFKPPPPRNDSELCMKLTSLGYPNVLWESISGRLTHQKPGIPGLASTGPKQAHSAQLKQDTEGITIPAFLSNTLATLLIYSKFTQKHCSCRSTWHEEGHTWPFAYQKWLPSNNYLLCPGGLECPLSYIKSHTMNDHSVTFFWMALIVWRAPTCFHTLLRVWAEVLSGG